MKRFALFLCLFAASVLTLIGCGQKLPDGIPPLNPVLITVTIDGEPMEGIGVNAFPKESAAFSGLTFFGKTDAAGVAEMMTNGLYSGLPEGEMILCAEKTLSVDGPTKIAQANKPPINDRDELTAYSIQVEKERTEFRIIGTDYNTKETSPLSLTVKKGKNNLSFDIPKDGTQLKFAD